MFDENEDPKPLDTTALEDFMFARLMGDFMSTPEQLSHDAERIMHALDALTAVEMPVASAQAVVDVLTTPPRVVRNYAVVEAARAGERAIIFLPVLRSDHERFAASLERIRAADMPPEATPAADDLGGVGDPKEHVAVLLRASAQAWATWADITSAVEGQ